MAEHLTTQFVIDYEICLRPSTRAATKHPDPLSRRIADALRAAIAQTAREDVAICRHHVTGTGHLREQIAREILKAHGLDE